NNQSLGGSSALVRQPKANTASGGISSVSLSFAQQVWGLQFRPWIGGTCNGTAQVQLFNGATLVGTTTYNYCAQSGMFYSLSSFNKAIITSPGVSSNEALSLD